MSQPSELWVVESKHIDSDNKWFRPIDPSTGVSAGTLKAERVLAECRAHASDSIVYRISRYRRVDAELATLKGGVGQEIEADCLKRALATLLIAAKKAHKELYPTEAACLLDDAITKMEDALAEGAAAIRRVREQERKGK